MPARLSTLLLLLLLPAAAPSAQAEDAFAAELAQWRAQREAGLVRDDGWAALVALHWLDDRRATAIGSHPDDGLRLASLPPHWGRIGRDDGRWRLHLADAAGVEVDGAAADGPAVDLVSDLEAGRRAVPATRVRAGTVRMTLIERGGRHALRVWDEQAPSRVGFAGLEHFPADPSWRIEGTWVAHQPARSIDIATVINTVEPSANPGAVEFERDGRRHRLEVLAEPDADQLFVIFADRSNRRATYGAGRYLYADRPGPDGRVVLDFNRAYNPPCAFTAHATCPLPPPENRLDLAVEAGELRYRGPVGK
jgi:uncharacterized protein (DUF1684 family)